MFSEHKAIVLTLTFFLSVFSSIQCCFAQHPTSNESARIDNKKSIQTVIKEIESSLASDLNIKTSKLGQSFDAVSDELLGINEFVMFLLDKARVQPHPTVQRSILKYYSKSAVFHKIFVDYALKNMTTKVEQDKYNGIQHFSKLDPYPYAMYLVHQDCYDRMIVHFCNKSPKEVSELELDLAANILVSKYESGTAPKRLLSMLDIDITDITIGFDPANLSALRSKVNSYYLPMKN